MASFLSLVQEAMFSTNNDIRAQAEKKLIEYCQQDPSGLLKLSAVELANESTQVDLRQACGTLIMKCVKMAGKNEGSNIWLELDSKVQTYIRQILLSALITKVTIVRRSAANAISAIAGIDLPKNQWNDLIPMLANNCNTSDVEVKKAAILTLGFVCEELKQIGQPDCIVEDQKENILMGILLGLQDSETNTDIREYAIKALHDSLNFMEKHLIKKEIRDYVMKLLIFSFNLPKKEIKILTSQCFIDLCKLHYDKIADYIVPIYEVLSPIMIGEEEIAIPAIEVFNSLANEDRDRANSNLNNSQNLIKLVHFKLVPILLHNLLREAQENEDGELSLQETATKCLYSIVEVTGNDCLDIFQHFISNTLGSDQYLHRKAALIAFATLMEGPSKERVEGMIMAALDKIVLLLNDHKDKVKIAASFTLSKISELHPHMILSNPNFININNIFIESIKAKQEISRNICWVYNFLADHFQNLSSEEINNHKFFASITNILNHLINNAFRKDIKNTDLHLIDISFMAIINIIHYVKNSNIALQYLRIFIDQFKNSYTFQSVGINNIQSGLLSAMHTALLRINNLEDGLAVQVYNLVIDDFKLKKEVTGDGIYAISSLATAWKKGFLAHIDDYWNYLLYALGKPEDIELFKSAIGSMADVSRAVEEGFVKFLPSVVPALIKCLHSTDLDRDVKLHIFLCLGDIALGCKTALIDYMEDIKAVFNLAFAAVYDLAYNRKDDSDSLEYSESLKDRLVESYICFVHTFGGTPSEDVLLNHFPNLFAFLNNACNSKLNPTLEFLRNCLALIADIANFYKSKVTPLVKTHFTQGLINSLQKFIHFKENEEIIKYAVHVIGALK